MRRSNFFLLAGSAPAIYACRLRPTPVCAMRASPRAPSTKPTQHWLTAPRTECPTSANNQPSSKRGPPGTQRHTAPPRGSPIQSTPSFETPFFPPQFPDSLRMLIRILGATKYRKKDQNDEQTNAHSTPNVRGRSYRSRVTPACSGPCRKSSGSSPCQIGSSPPFLHRQGYGDRSQEGS
jgi:hypothetical protein